MNAILTRPLKKGIKTIYGKILREGLGTITLLVPDKKGSGSIKTFKADKWTIRHYQSTGEKEEVKCNIDLPAKN